VPLARRARDAGSSVHARKSSITWNPMHPSYKSDIPGIAPDCRMQVEPVYEEPTTASASSEGGMVSHRQIPRTAPAGAQSYMQPSPSASALVNV
jgi:hypothetical protein